MTSLEQYYKQPTFSWVDAYDSVTGEFSNKVKCVVECVKVCGGQCVVVSASDVLQLVHVHVVADAQGDHDCAVHTQQTRFLSQQKTRVISCEVIFRLNVGHSGVNGII